VNEHARTSRVARFLRRHATVIHWGSLAALLLGLFLMARSLPLDRFTDGLQAWVDGTGAWGPIVFGLIHMTAMLMFITGTVFALAAGAIFFMPVAVVVVFLATTAAAALAFLISRHLARDRVSHYAHSSPKFQAVNQAIDEGGWKIIVLIRLSPAIPFNLQNYLYGLTRVRFEVYVAASALAILPRAVLYPYLGYITGAAIDDRGDRTTLEWVGLLGGLLATIVLTAYLTHRARQALGQQERLAAVIDDDSDCTSPQSASTDGKLKAGLPWGTLNGLLVAIIVLSFGVWSYTNPDTVRHLVETFFNLPLDALQ
jgi:uncharacterized membrane protein YdjX (TVP38/TMEM64 family)